MRKDYGQVKAERDRMHAQLADVIAERDRLRRLVYLIYRSTHDRPLDEIDWLAPWARELLGETIETVKREVAGSSQLDASEATDG